ncbi:MAG: DUF721 domain-containing protein [Actinomycetota bacterium]
MGEPSIARLRDLLGAAGARLGMSAPVETGMLWARWDDIVGEQIADHASPTSLRDGVLRVCADSPAWANEIGYLGDELRRRCNEAVGRELVREVRVWTGPRARRRRGAPGRPGHQSERATASPDTPQEALERARRAWVARRPSEP